MFAIKYQITQNHCAGCGACALSCPTKAIEIVKNAKGELVPEINKRLCVKCNICKTTCPQNNPPEFLYPQKCYVAWSKNSSDLLYSASGGIGATFMRYVIGENGVAYGCDYDKNLDLLHFPIKDEHGLLRSQSSKYSQSKSYNTFAEIKNELIHNKLVLFIGTPCQVSALKKYLKQEYQSLITIDLVCHGTPPNEYLKEHLNNISNEKVVSKVRFRGEFDQKLTVWSNDSIIYQKNHVDDIYFNAFYQNMISMDSCFFCQYAKPKRVSDITIGDFWGLGTLQKIKKQSDRPSAILINSQKGQDFFETVKENLVCEERTVEECIAGNGRLNYPPGKDIYAHLFRYLYPILKFEKAIKVTMFMKYHLTKK